MKKYLYLCFALAIGIELVAQQASRLTQSADDFGLDNPAGLSFEEMRYRGTVLSGLIRNQWWIGDAVGYPRTQALSWLDTRPEHYQYGAAILADKVGETRSFGLMARYAHTLAEGLKIGLSASGNSQRIAVERLDQYDVADPLAAAAGDTRWRLAVSAGAFYHIYQRNRAWNWFAGLAVRHGFALRHFTENAEAPAETDLLAQGGIGRGAFWAGGRLRMSLHLPGALDVYARQYFSDERFFLGGIFTTDSEHQTAGVQAGMERLLSSRGDKGNHFLTLSFSFARPLSHYVEGGSLIFDGRITWSWEQ